MHVYVCMYVYIYIKLGKLWKSMPGFHMEFYSLSWNSSIKMLTASWDRGGPGSWLNLFCHDAGEWVGVNLEEQIHGVLGDCEPALSYHHFWC